MKLIFTNSMQNGLETIKRKEINNIIEFNNFFKQELLNLYGEAYFLEEENIDLNNLNENNLYDFLWNFIEKSDIVDNSTSKLKLFNDEDLKELTKELTSILILL